MNRGGAVDRFLLMTCFARAVETGSFSAAGRDLGLGQPNVSRYVAALEDHLQSYILLERVGITGALAPPVYAEVVLDAGGRTLLRGHPAHPGCGG